MNVVLLKHASETGGVEKFVSSFLAESRFNVSLLNVDIPMGFAGRWTYLWRLYRALPRNVDAIVSCHIDTVGTGMHLARWKRAYHVFREPAGAVHPFQTPAVAARLKKSLCIALSHVGIDRWRNVGFEGTAVVIRPRIHAFEPMRFPRMDVPLNLVQVANLFPEKNHAAGIALLKDLARCHPHAVRLDIIGQPNGTAYSSETEELILQTDGAQLVSNVASVQKELEHYSCGILTSESEGFGYVLLEYASSGLPFFTTKTEGISEVLPGDSPLFLPPDPGLWATHMVRCMESPAWRMALASAQQTMLATSTYIQAYDEAIHRHCNE